MACGRWTLGRHDRAGTALHCTQGIILERGTHEELSAIPDGAYARLVQAQEKAHYRGDA